MKRLFFVFLSILWTVALWAQIYRPEGLNMPGSWNDWKNPPTNPVFASDTQAQGKITRLDDLLDPVYQTVFSTFTSGGDVSAGTYAFVFTSGPASDPWRNKWTDVKVQLNTVQVYAYHNDYGGDNDTVTLNADKWYVVNWNDLGYTNTQAIFMELSSRPACIDSVVAAGDTIDWGDSLLVKVFLDTIPAPEQKFYVRYTSDSWQTSYLTPVISTDTGYFAYIPGKVSAQQVQYYVFSTVIDNPTSYFDLVTISYDNNGADFYSFYVKGQPEPQETTPQCDYKVSAVYPYPPLPVEDSGVVIYFDATLGNGALANYQGDIYAHTGVITNKSPDSTYWLHVVSDWGENLPSLKFTPVGPNLYKLVIPNIRQFYGITDTSEHVEKIAMVIRSGEPISPDNPDEFIVARQEDGSDFFVDVYRSNQLVAKVITPNKYNYLYAEDDTVTICAFSLNADSTFLYVDDSLVGAVTDDSIMVQLSAKNLGQGNHIAKVVSVCGSQTVSNQRQFVVLQPVQVADLPQGVSNGVNIMDDGSVVFVLWDPPAKKKYAFVIGDFNNWQADANYYMNRTPDGQHFWLRVTGLDPDKEYAYQYFIDGRLRLADPYAHKILDPWNDQYIPSYNYPDLKPYPYGKTYGIVSTFKINQTPYQWQVTNFTPTAINDKQPNLLVYELLVRDFVKTSALKDVTAKLDYLKNLGINAIEIMPVNEFEGNISWGYNPDFYFAVDKYYGTSDDFKQFVDQCHKRGIAVILDVVFNHSFGLCPLVQMYWDPTKNCPSADNPWYNQVAPHPLSPGYDFNHESVYTRQFVKDVLKYWLTEYKVDGFRFDLSKGFTQRYSADLGAWSAYDQSRIDILEDYYDYIKSINPNAYVVLEHFADNDEETVLANYGFLLWQNMSENYGQALMGWLDNSDFSWAYYKNRGFTYPNNLVFMESHDEERLMYKALQWGNSTAGYTVRSLDTALNREKALVSFWATMPGPRMMWEFGELGYDYSINYCASDGTYSEDCRTSPKPPRWDYYYDPDRLALYNVYRKIFNWKQQNAIFRLGQFSQSSSGYIKEQWFSSDTFNIYMIANFDVADQQATLNFQHSGTWYNVFTGTSLDVSGKLTKTLHPGQFFIYADKKVNLVTDITAGISEQKPVQLKVYPNPATSYVTISAPEQGKVVVYNMFGQIVMRQNNVGPGSGFIDLQTLAPGSYILIYSSAHYRGRTVLLKVGQ